MPHLSPNTQIVERFLEAKRKLEAAGSSADMNDVVDTLHTLGTLRALLCSRLSSGLRNDVGDGVLAGRQRRVHAHVVWGAELAGSRHTGMQAWRSLPPRSARRCMVSQTQPPAPSPCPGGGRPRSRRRTMHSSCFLASATSSKARWGGWGGAGQDLEGQACGRGPFPPSRKPQPLRSGLRSPQWQSSSYCCSPRVCCSMLCLLLFESDKSAPPRTMRKGGAESLVQGKDGGWALPLGSLVLGLRQVGLGTGPGLARECAALEQELATWQRLGGFGERDNALRWVLGKGGWGAGEALVGGARETLGVYCLSARNFWSCLGLTLWPAFPASVHEHAYRQLPCSVTLPSGSRLPCSACAG